MPAIYKNGRVYGGKAQELEDLTNVNIDTSTLDDGQGLIYDETSGEWVNGNVSSGGGTAATTTFDDTNVEFKADDVQEAFEEITKTVTQAEYDALPSAEKLNGTIYLISDGTATNVVECTQATYPATPEQDTFYLISDAPSLQGTSADLLYESGSATTTKAKIDSKADTTDVVLKTDLILVKALDFASGTSRESAISSIITTYGKVPISFSFVIQADDYYEGFINFYGDTKGGGYLVKTTTNTFYSVAYNSGTVTCYEKANKSDFTTTEVYTPTLQNVSTSTSASEKIWYWKSGKVVTMAVDLIVGTTSTLLVVMNLPSGFRPATNITTAAMAFGTSANALRYCQIFSNGNVAFYSADSARLLFTITFVTE